MRSMKRMLTGAILLGVAGSAGCSSDGATPTSAPHAALSLVSAAGAQVITGDFGPGANYVLYKPADWNGDLVLLAHGYGPPPLLPADGYLDPALRDGLLAQGYAVAASAFSYGGFFIKDAMVRTAQLENLARQSFGRPTHTYLMSISLGASVVMRLAEQNPKKYAGVMPICGIVGGVPYELNHFFNTRALFDYYFPGVLPGDAVNNPGWIDLGAVYTALGGDVAKAKKLADIDQVKMTYSSDAEMMDDVAWALFFNAFPPFISDVLTQTHGHPFFDNSTLQYTGSGDDATLNAGVQRFSATPDALNVLQNLYSPTGKLLIPVLSLHTRYDNIVPVRHEYVYEQLAVAAGSGDMFVHRIFDRPGHCAVSADEQLQAFQDLVGWVENGVKPVGTP